jgi:uncharacterized membrane protein YtjA (UPF0391 family)
MMSTLGILLAIAIVAGVLGFWGVLGAFTTAAIVIFWLALALLMTSALVGAAGGRESFR